MTQQSYSTGTPVVSASHEDGMRKSEELACFPTGANTGSDLWSIACKDS